jgi:hypothetical protein
MSDSSVSELLSRATSREVATPGDARSRASFESVVIDGQGYFVKRLSPKSDWVMRATGDHVHRPYLVWRARILDRVPACIDHTVVAMEVSGEGDDAELTVLMRDVGPHLVPEGDAVVPEAQHRGFVDHLAQLTAAFWGWQDTVGGLTTMAERVRFFDSANVARELAVAEPPGAIVAADRGWRALLERAPRLARVARAVQDHPEMLIEPLAATPVAFLHGDWKMGNLGTHPDGRTILIDWALPGSGPPCWDLCWYLALNRARLPEAKEATVSRFRDALERHGKSTEGWFDTQLDLCIVGMMATFGWEKALGDDNELRWWERTVLNGVTRQRLDVPA